MKRGRRDAFFRGLPLQAGSPGQAEPNCSPGRAENKRKTRRGGPEVCRVNPKDVRVDPNDVGPDPNIVRVGNDVKLHRKMLGFTSRCTSRC